MYTNRIPASIWLQSQTCYYVSRRNGTSIARVVRTGISSFTTLVCTMFETDRRDRASLNVACRTPSLDKRHHIQPQSKGLLSVALKAWPHTEENKLMSQSWERKGSVYTNGMRGLVIDAGRALCK